MLGFVNLPQCECYRNTSDFSFLKRYHEGYSLSFFRSINFFINRFWCKNIIVMSSRFTLVTKIWLLYDSCYFSRSDSFVWTATRLVVAILTRRGRRYGRVGRIGRIGRNRGRPTHPTVQLTTNRWHH